MLFALGVFSILLLLYLLFTAIWNVFFHPLRCIPGPKLWIAVPFIRHFYAIRGRLPQKTRTLHTQYGEALRISPNEVTFIASQALKDINGTDYDLKKVPTVANSPSNIISANHEDHARFRKALSPAFSAKALQGQEPLITGHVDTLIRQLKRIAETGQPADMTKWYNLMAFDVVGQLAFGDPFGCLDSGEYHPWVETIIKAVSLSPFVFLMDEYPKLTKLILGLKVHTFLRAVKRHDEFAQIKVQKRLDRPETGHEHIDFMDSMLKNRGQKDEMKVHEIEANSKILVIAGSETTATLLAGVTYLLLKAPEKLEKVTREVRSNMESETDITFIKTTARLPYMLACLTEAFRMYPPAFGMFRRLTPETPVTISGYEIPPRTIVSVAQLAAFTSPMNFHHADQFIPERWLPDAKDPSSPFFSDKRDVLQPFSIGPRNCIGQNMAYMEMRLALARMLWNFDLEICDESRNWKNQKAYSLWHKPPLMCRLRQRVTN